MASFKVPGRIRLFYHGEYRLQDNCLERRIVCDQLEYLNRNLERRASDVRNIIQAAVDTVTRRNAAVGRLESGSTFISFREEAQKVFTEEFRKAAQFTFNLLGNVECDARIAMDLYSRKAEFVIMQVIKNSAGRVGLPPVETEPLVAPIAAELNTRLVHLMDDFSQGMLGYEKLKKDPSVSIVNMQTNSPGAVQQVGSGNFSQTAFTQHYQTLISAVDTALASPEFQTLDVERQDEFRDVADVVKLEAAKDTPDQGKLKRWGGKLVTLAKDAGMQTVAGSIGAILTKILVG
jgi:hypothetical protein